MNEKLGSQNQETRPKTYAAAIVVKGVGQLVANNRSNRAIVDVARELGREEGRLEDPGGEDNLVERRLWEKRR